MQKVETRSLSTQTKYNLAPPENINDYFDEKVPDRRWEVTVDWRTKIYLTDDERDYFLKMLSNNAKIIQVGKLTLTSKFNCIVPIRNKRENKEFQLVDGVMKEV